MKVSMHVDDIGGPSAGMNARSIDKVTGEQLSGGKTIAGTGTMNAKGKVGAIGGIRLKMIGASATGPRGSLPRNPTAVGMASTW